MQPIQPFAWDQLPSVSAATAAVLERASAWLDAGRHRPLTALSPVLGAPLALEVASVGPRSPSRVDTLTGERVRLEPAGGGPPAILEIDAPLALELVWACLFGRRVEAAAASRPLGTVERGALLYIIARVLTDLSTPPPLRVAGVAEPAEQVDAKGATVHLVLRAGELGGHAWLHLPSAVGRCPSPPTQRATGGRDLPTALHLEVGRSRLTAAQWRAVELDDVVLLDNVWLEPAEPAATITGEVRLRLPAGPPRWCGRLGSDGVVIIEAALAPRRTRMTEQADHQRPADPEELLEEIPAELSVELGRIPMTARQAVELRPGQPLKLGRQPGELVDLRIGPKLVARGELVQVEGELGVLLREVYTSDEPAD